MSKGTDYSFATRRLEVVHQKQQVPLHHGFHAEAITQRDGLRLHSDTDMPDPILAKPPVWTTESLCLNDFRFSGDDNLEELKPTCLACPVKDLCLAAALEDEQWETGSPLPAVHRAGIRGGLTPNERVRLTLPCPEKCSKGHPMSKDTALLNPQWASWGCRTCINEGKRRRRAERKAA